MSSISEAGTSSATSNPQEDLAIVQIMMDKTVEMALGLITSEHRSLMLQMQTSAPPSTNTGTEGKPMGMHGAHVETRPLGASGKWEAGETTLPTSYGMYRNRHGRSNTRFSRGRSRACCRIGEHSGH